MKTCFKCFIEKSIDEFYTHPRMTDGHLNKCKSCTKNDSKKRIKDKSNDLDWIEKELLRHRIKSKLARESGSQSKCLPIHKKEWLERNPLKSKAKNSVNNAIRDGRLSRQPCEICSNPKAQAHHDDYSKPLDVRWLCIPHHNEHHILERQKQRNHDKTHSRSTH